MNNFNLLSNFNIFLYINLYGLTRLRLLTSIFMAAIALLFIIMILFMYIKRFPAAKYAICCFAVIGLITGFCDVDRTVASYNVNAYKSGIMYKNGLYLFHAPINRNHIGILKINRTDIEKSEVVLQADMKGSCFYPFVQYDTEGNIYMSYTVDRKHIRISKFTFEKHIPD